MRNVRTRSTDHARTLKEAIRKVLSFDAVLRPRASDGRPGSLIEFPKSEKREFIIIGDLHANVRNLNAILEDSGNLEKVRLDKAVLLFLGDAVHNDKPGFTYAMDSSIEIMDIIVGLIDQIPNNVVYLLGNHDSFAPELSKLGIQQGLIYHAALLQARGKQ